ncbi:hypothetical protein ACS0TY_006832 [Phlomoides rotata]
MDPTWVALGLKVELDTLVVECKLVSDRIGEIISLDGENDNKVTSFAEFSNEFEEMEFSWKGCVKSIHLKKEFAKVDEAVKALYIVVSPFLLKLVILVIISLDCYTGMACFYSAHLVVSVQSLPHDPHEMKVITSYLLAVLGVASAAAGVGGGAAASAAAEPKKEEKVVQKEESDDDMCFGLFD